LLWQINFTTENEHTLNPFALEVEGHSVEGGEGGDHAMVSSHELGFKREDPMIRKVMVCLIHRMIY
jgi:hypothetical protein